MKHLFLLLTLLVFGCQDTQKEVNEVVVSDKIAEETTYNLGLEIYDYKGIEKYLNFKDDKVYVVNFWATWCAPCVKELPYFEELGETYSDKNVEVILISLDFPKHYKSKLIPFIEKHKLQSKVVVLDDPDMNSWIPKVNENWEGAIPATLIYNKDKSQFYEQSFNYEELKTEVNKFLN